MKNKISEKISESIAARNSNLSLKLNFLNILIDILSYSYGFSVMPRFLAWVLVSTFINTIIQKIIQVEFYLFFGCFFIYLQNETSLSYNFLVVNYQLNNSFTVKFQLISLDGMQAYQLAQQNTLAGAQQVKLLLPANISKGIYTLKMITKDGVNSKIVIVN
ncbi:MAG: hypothetical protein WBO44_04790 [Saprospiraceae bacterium]